MRSCRRAGEGTRTPDPLLTMEVLCRLSYSGVLLGARVMIPGTIERRPRGTMNGCASRPPCCSSPSRADPRRLPIRTSLLDSRSGPPTAPSRSRSRSRTPAERQTGLMGRETLEPFDGMAFVWSEPVEHVLDEGHADPARSRSGTTRAGSSRSSTWIPAPMTRVPRTDPANRSSAPSRSAGTFAMRGVAVGDTVELAVADA